MIDFGWFKEMGIAGFLDVLFMAFIFYIILAWFKRTRAGAVLTGILIIAAFYLITRQFGLSMTAQVFEQFFAVILIAIVVIFQEELRNFFEQVTVWSTRRRLRRQSRHLSRDEVSILVRTLVDLAREKIGALIVIRGKNMILRHLEGGIDLGGKLSEPLLKSLFDPHSVGHDGALVIEGNRLTQFSALLPLSKDIQKIGMGGTRHAAALGLSELSDALCLLVSEERGQISVAHNGEIQTVQDAEKLTAQLERFYQEVYPQRELKNWRDHFRKNWREKIIAMGLAVSLWFVLIHGGKLTYRTYQVPVTYTEIKKPWAISKVDPEKVSVTFHGPRSAFYFLTLEDIKLFIKVNRERKEQYFRLVSSDFIFPKNIVVDTIKPDVVRIHLEKEEDKPKT